MNEKDVGLLSRFAVSRVIVSKALGCDMSYRGNHTVYLDSYSQAGQRT